jgi:hypothetical protein
MPLVDVAAAQTHIRQAHEDSIAAMESVLRVISRKRRMPQRAGSGGGGWKTPGRGDAGLNRVKYRYRLLLHAFALEHAGVM